MDVLGICLRIIAVLLAIVIAYVIYIAGIKPFLMKKCIISGENCMKVMYYILDTSLLFFVQNYGYWVWYNGIDIFVYGYPTGNKCKNPDYEPAYNIAINSPMPTGYTCVMNLNSVKKFYTDRVQPEYLVFSMPNPSVYDILNLFQEKGIMDFNRDSQQEPTVLVSLN